VNDNKYKEYFLSDEEKWYNKLENTKLFIDKEYRKPSTTSENKNEKKIGKWISRQKEN